MKKIRLIALFLIITLPVKLFPNFQNLRFERLTIADGLSLSSVYCIYKDSKGFMWFGTEDGLNRYDGQNFKIFRANPYDTNTISYKWIESIVEDINGNLWLGSKGGLSLYFPQHESFLQFNQRKLNSFRISNDTITTLCQSENNYLVAGTVKGLNVIDISTFKCQIISEEYPDLDAIINEVKYLGDNNYLIGAANGLYVLKIKTDGELVITPLLKGHNIEVISLHSDKLWLGSDSFLRQYSFDIQNFENLVLLSEIRLDYAVENILHDNLGQTWVSLENGLYIIKEHQNSIVQIIETRNLSHSLAVNTGNPIIQDLEGNIWLGTHGNGVYHVSPKNKKAINIRNNPVNLQSLSENSINYIFEDTAGTIWFGTFGAGISAYNPSWQKFELLTHDPLNQHSLSSNFIWSIFEDRHGKVWIGTNDHGITIYNPEDNSYSKVEHSSSNNQGLPHESVRKVYEDSKGYIWIGTDGGGLSQYDPGSNNFKHFQHNDSDPTSLSSNSVRVIFEDSKGNIWIGTRNGLNLFQESSMSFKVFRNDPANSQSLSHNFIYSVIHEDKKGFLWIGTYGGGLNKFSPDKETFTSYFHDENNKNSLSDDIVFSIFETQEGNFWIGTNSGLCFFNTEKDEFVRFGIDQGLPNEVIYGVLPDDNENIWLSTNYGISCFNLNTQETRNYNISDGLQSNEFNGGAFHKGKSGKLYFGGVYGLNILDLSRLDDTKTEPRIVFTNLEILGHTVSPMTGQINEQKRTQNKIHYDSTGFYIPTNISYSDRIVFDYANRNFSIEFNELSNPLNNNNQFAYFIENLDAEWNYTGSRNYVSFANLKHGNYTIRVKAQAQNGSWDTPESALNIVIKPPFYKSWWFVLIEVILALVIAFIIYKYLIRQRTYKLLKEHNEQINRAYVQLKQSEEALLELNATKDKFFSIISHDLKNPFASLMSISEMMKENFGALDDEEKLDGIQRIHGSIENIFSLLENLLTWARSQSGRIDFNPSDFNISKVLQENYNLFKLAAERKKIRLESEFEEDLMAYADREMINTIVRNLVNNAIKFTPENKQVKITCTNCNNEVCVTVSDEGVGISEENREKLFKIDKKVKTKGTAGEKGTGLGLIICHEFIEKNKGTIKVKSEIDHGSSFTFTIPGK